jgi:LDH2 family malate/lactate/ureidoglycolate dehydrogenase
VDAAEGLSRLRALGFDEADAKELWAHFDGAESRGKHGHGHARIPWLEGLEGYDPAAVPTLLPPPADR